MKNTRKKMLLSSVAMLLVALVALGSATYAWFTVQKTVTADNMVVRAIATAGLEISNTSATQDFDTTKSFGQTDAGTGNAAPFSLKPVSWDGATTDAFIPSGSVTDKTAGKYTGEFKATGTGNTPAVTADGNPSMGHNDYFAVYEVWVRSAASNNVRTAHDVSAKVTIGGTNKTFARVKLVDVEADTNYIYGDAKDDAAKVVKAAGSTKSEYAVKAHDAAQAVTGTDTTDTGKKYQLFVWFDGEDAQCVDNAKGNTANITITFEATDM